MTQKNHSHRISAPRSLSGMASKRREMIFEHGKCSESMEVSKKLEFSMGYKLSYTSQGDSHFVVGNFVENWGSY